MTLWPLLLLCAGASAQTAAVVRRGDIQAQVRVTGTVIAGDIFRLKSPINGRVATASISTFTWQPASKVLGVLADTELSAILDAHGSTGNDILEERWQKIYKPTKIQCPSECFILRSFIKPRQTIKAQAVLLEAARTLRMTGYVKPEDARWVKYNQSFEFWPVKNPQKKQTGTIKIFEIVENDPKRAPGGYLTFDLAAGFHMNPGTEWEGVIHAAVKKKILTVPTAALLTHENRFYLPVEVSTGIGTLETVQIFSDEDRGFLILDSSKMNPALRLKFAPPAEPAPTAPAPVLEAPKAGKQDESIQEPDPYEE